MGADLPGARAFRRGRDSAIVAGNEAAMAPPIAARCPLNARALALAFGGELSHAVCPADAEIASTVVPIISAMISSTASLLA